MLARHNKLCGRAETSRVDLDIYCPPNVLHVGGPLFGDVDGIHSALNNFLAHKLSDAKLEADKCSVCGWPDCECSACEHLSTRTSKAKQGHTCCLKHAPAGRPKTGGFYDAELTELLKIAWLEKGIDSIPVFGKLNGRSGYFWQEELI